MTEPSSANFPSALADDNSLLANPVNLQQFTLSGNHNDSVATITTTGAMAGITAPGYIRIESELIFFTGILGADFTGCDRGADGTVAAAHTDATPIYVTVAANYFKQLKKELIAAQQGIWDFCKPVGGRLTLTSGTPVTSADVTAAATLYLTPYISNVTSLYNVTKSEWIPIEFSEISASVAALNNGKNYDIFEYLSGGAVALDAVVWTNDTTRASALAWQDGRLVKSGAANYRYRGTIRMSAAGQTEDSAAKRFVFNNDNPVHRILACVEGTNHAYNGALRKWNNSDVNNLLSIVVGNATPLRGSVTAVLRAGADGNYAVAYLYVDGSTTSSGCVTYNVQLVASGSSYDFMASAGFHTIQLWEAGNHASSTFERMRIYYGVTM